MTKPHKTHAQHEYRLKHMPTGRIVTVVGKDPGHIHPRAGWGEAFRWHDHAAEVVAGMAGSASDFAFVGERQRVDA